MNALKKIIAEPPKKNRIFGPINPSSSVDAEQSIIFSLTPQYGEQFGTVTFASTKYKERALKEKGLWSCDEAFDGITVVHSGSNPSIE